MALFTYSATKRNGETVRGERSAEDRTALAAILRAEGLLLLDISTPSKGLTSAGKASVGELISRIRPVSVVDKMFFTRNLAVMIAAGLALPRALETLARESHNRKFSKIMNEVAASVIGGKSFADSLRIHEKVFGALFIHMIEVGEASGKLTLILKLLGNQMKKDLTLRRRVRNAMMYPAIIIAALVGIGTLMMIYVVPALTATIRSLGGTLPLTTRMIIGMSEALLHYGLFIAMGFLALIFAVWRFLKSEKGKNMFDRVVMKVLLFGPLVRKYNSARFCRSLSYLLTAGIPIVRALEITSRVLGNALFQGAADEAAKSVEKGKELHVILENHPEAFGSLVVQMVAVGEETGKLSDMLLRLAIFFEEEVGDTTKNLSIVIEPLLMIVVGTGVGIFALSMLQPIYSSLGNL